MTIQPIKLLRKIPVVDAFVHRPWPVLLALVILSIGLVLNDMAGAWVFSIAHKGPPLFDLVHEAIPPIDLNWIVSALHWVLIYTSVFYYILIQWEDLAPTLLIFGLFFALRALFLYVNILPEPWPRIDDRAIMDVPGVYYGTQDLFPSGHSGSLCILALTARKIWFKIFITLGTIIMGASVVLMHVHYTFDVLGAFCIAYAVYALVDRHWTKTLRGFRPAQPS